jgi:nucleoside-diphosphate-sugar epimerase
VVAGGCGFLGSHLVRLLCEDRGCDVLVIDNLVAGRREFLHPAAKFCHADITGSEEYLRSVIAGHKARFAWNLAAFPYVPDSYARPIHVFTVNANGAMKFINACQEGGVEGIAQVSSAEIFGDGAQDEDGYITEDTPVRPHSTYGVAKAAIDYYVQARWREAGTPCLAIRQFNSAGEFDCLHPYVLVAIYDQLRGQDRNEVATVKLGNNAYRNFIYAGDAVRIMVELLEHGEWGEVYNVGSEEGVKVYELAGMVARVMGFPGVRVEEDEARKRRWEIWKLRPSCDKLYRALGYRPTFTPLLETVRRTVRWFEENGYR